MRSKERGDNNDVLGNFSFLGEKGGYEEGGGWWKWIGYYGGYCVVLFRFFFRIKGFNFLVNESIVC